MCRIYNTVGSLNFIQSHLVKNNLDEFDSLEELIAFQKKHQFHEQKVITDHTLLIQNEKKILEDSIAELTENLSAEKDRLEADLKNRLADLNKQIETLTAPDSKIISVIIDYYKNTAIWIKIWLAPILFRLRIIMLKRKSNKPLTVKKDRFAYIETNFQEAVHQSSFLELQWLQRKNKLVKKINNYIYGAIGEQKVVDTLEKLPDDFILINDFSCTFRQAIRNRSENDFIKSIQIDHLLISPSGIFLIETKHWSKYSLEKPYLFSPVQQVKRTNYALYRIVTNEMSTAKWNFKRSNWGNRKIPIRNLIVFTNEKPNEEFEFVKILGLHELLGYIQYFKPCFNAEETKTIADFLMNVSDRKNVVSRLRYKKML